MAKACLQCGGPCKNDKRTFCSQKCRGVHRSANTKKKVRLCESGCGTACKTVYRRFCSPSCSAKSPGVCAVRAATHIGRKQSAEQVANRVANTNQKAKEAKRKATMIERFGVDNYGHTESHKERMSILHKGRSNPRVPGQQERIIATKIRNGTTKHSKATKRKMVARLHERYSDPNHDRSVYITNVFNPFTGYYRGLYYRSSYELKFLQFCRKYFIDVLPASTKEFAVPYVDPYGSERMYYPDFYLPEFDMVVEIKPSSMVGYGANPQKFAAARRKYDRFCVLTELSGYVDKKQWHDLYYGQIMEWCSEHLCYGS